MGDTVDEASIRLMAVCATAINAANNAVKAPIQVTALSALEMGAGEREWRTRSLWPGAGGSAKNRDWPALTASKEFPEFGTCIVPLNPPPAPPRRGATP